jgi:hypothetical protein
MSRTHSLLEAWLIPDVTGLALSYLEPAAPTPCGYVATGYWEKAMLLMQSGDPVDHPIMRLTDHIFTACDNSHQQLAIALIKRQDVKIKEYYNSYYVYTDRVDDAILGITKEDYLESACMNGLPLVVSHLLQSGQRVSERCIENAFDSNHIDIFKMVCEWQDERNVYTLPIDTKHVMSKKFPKAYKYLTRQTKCRISHIGVLSNVMTKACRKGNLAIVKYLSTLKCNTTEGYRAACLSGHLDIVMFLVTVKDYNIQHGIFWANHESHFEVSDYLKSLGK